MYRITCILAEKIAPQGFLIRMPSALTYDLSTEEGVMAFIMEQFPFKSITIINVETKEDLTKYFLGE